MDMKPKIELFVVTHKELDDKKYEYRHIIRVGKNLENTKYTTDNIGKNISHKNASFCELTAFYWMVYNSNAEYIGLEHYRRVFSEKKVSIFSDKFLTERTIFNILEKNDIIMPTKSTYRNESVFQQYSNSHISDDLLKCRDIIYENYPKYSSAFDYCILKANKLYQYNMFIAKKEVIKPYADWLFDILFRLEKEINIDNRSIYQKRVFGFLSERLFNVWIFANNIKVKEQKVLFLEHTAIKNTYENCKLIVKKKFYNKIKK